MSQVLAYGSHYKRGMNAADASARLAPACPTCERLVRAGEYFCADCGTAMSLRWLLVPRCGQCGGLNPAGYRYCVDCGTPKRSHARDIETTVSEAPALLVDPNLRGPTLTDSLPGFDPDRTDADASADSFCETATWRAPPKPPRPVAPQDSVRTGDTLIGRILWQPEA